MNNVCHSPWMFTNKVSNPREDNWVTQSMKDTELSEIAEWGFFHAYQLCMIHIIHIKIISRYKAFLKPGILFLMWLLAGNIHFYLHPTTFNRIDCTMMMPLQQNRVQYKKFKGQVTRPLYWWTFNTIAWQCHFRSHTYKKLI